MSGMIGVLIFFGILFAGVYGISLLRSSHTDQLTRLSKHQKRLAEKAPEVEETIFTDQSRDDHLSRVLAEAGMEAQYEQMKTTRIVAGIGTGVVLWALSMVMAKDLAAVAVIFGIPLGVFGFNFYLGHLAHARQAKMTEQLPQVLETMVSSLKAGSPVMETFKTLSETAPEPIRSEFKRALISLQLGKSFREAIQEMSTRIRTGDFKLLAQAIFISQDVGANLADVVAVIAEAIRERFKLRDFMNALTAQGKATAVFIGVLPYGITAMTYMMTPTYIIPFFNNGIARAIFFAMILWEFVGFYILMKLCTFEV